VKIIVLGGGVIGVTSAWYLNRAGHEVVLLERQSQAARETSYANGGQVSWGSGGPWAAPGVPAKALRWLFHRHAPLVLRPRLDPELWSWLWQMRRECTPERYLRNKRRQLRLARYSHAALAALRADTGIHYDERSRGTLVLHRDPREFAAARQELSVVEDFGIPTRLLDPAGCVQQEPALAAATGQLAGGILYPGDELGDCRQFTEQLAARLQADGVELRTGTTVLALVPDHHHIEQVLTDRGSLRGDAYVLACGSYSPLLAQPIGIRLPIYPVKGYSITVPITDDAHAPQGTLTDESYKTVITRLGSRLRAAGTAELAGYDLRIRPRRLETLKHVVRQLFPLAGDLAQAEGWAGLRPMTPDNPPVLGTTRYRNLYLNTGHGTLGWTMACGSARVLADVVSGRTPEIDLDGLTLERFETP
jgi:D-amino-acid dehydrogenase